MQLFSLVTLLSLFLSHAASSSDSSWETWGAPGATSSFKLAGSTGVSAMQLTVINDDELLILDKAENNRLQINDHPAWGAIYTISTSTSRAIDLETNSFCAGGSWLGNGTLVSVSGNPATGKYKDQDGLQAIRLLNPCTSCKIYENPSRIRLTSARWYPSTTRMSDGSLFILGDNPTFEWYPPKGDGLPIYSKFLQDALKTNLFPITFLLPSGKLFVAANLLAMLFDPNSNTEQRLPGIPGGVRINYPASASAALLPLMAVNNWSPEVLICGGTSANVEGRLALLSTNTPASDQCIRMFLSPSGIKQGWELDRLPDGPRVMGNAVLTPDGKVFIVNGARSGMAGYGNVQNLVGRSNAANPAYRPVLYNPTAKRSQRWLTKFPSSSIERLYHSSATVLPDGRIFVAGSNPNGDVSSVKYATRYEGEIFSRTSLLPPLFPVAGQVRVVLLDLGFSTHGLLAGSRLVELRILRRGLFEMTVLGPQTPSTYPPGFGWVFVLVDGVPSTGRRVTVGTGAGPPVSEFAIRNLLASTPLA
ncbi:hypothetical protein T439DRAFT_342652 [Meredithblackwellia eburnea MCA 4105]